jgi:hypothetical protein
VVIQPTDGKIVAAGYTGTSTGNEFALARYLGGSTTTTATAAVSTQAETTSTADRTVPVLIPLATGSDPDLNLFALERFHRTRRVRVASGLAPLLLAR